MDDIPLCPEWWPHMLWQMHFPVRWPGGGKPPPPVNYPPIINDIMANLHIHTMSYMLLDQAAAQQIRSVAEQRLTDAVQNLSRYHEGAMEQGHGHGPVGEQLHPREAFGYMPASMAAPSTDYRAGHDKASAPAESATTAAMGQRPSNLPPPNAAQVTPPSFEDLLRPATPGKEEAK